MTAVTVTVTIARAQVLADMKVKSHVEVAIIADPTERYLAELGEEKTQEAHQCINDAAVELLGQLRQFLLGARSTSTSSATDAFESSGDLTFILYVLPRKASGLAAALVKVMHAYVVDSALAKYYISVSRPELAERHQSKLGSELAVIENIIRRRTSPIYPTS